MKRIRFLTIISIIAFSLLISISNESVQGATDSLVILHPHSSDFASHVIDAFKTWYAVETGNTITIMTSEKYSGDCYADVVAWDGMEPEADVWWGGGEFYFEQARQLDLLQPYNVTEDLNITDYLGGWHLKDDSGDYSEHVWYAAALSGFGIIYNTEYLSTEGLDTPDSWDDLTDFQYFGHISMCDPDLSGSTVAIVKQVLAEMSDQNSDTEITMEADITDAWEYWVQVSGNVGTFTTGSSAVPTAVAERNAGIGLCIDYYALDRMVADDNIGFTYGGATTVSPDPAGIIKGARNLEPAKKFMDFLTGTEGQNLVGDYRTPANFKATSATHVPKAFDTSGSPTISFPVIIPFSPSIDRAIHSQAEILFTNWIVQNHAKLKATWEEIGGLADGTTKDNALDELTKLPSDFNGTMGGLQALDYKNSTVTDNWKAEGATNFDEALSFSLVTIDSPLQQTYKTETITVTLSGSADNFWYYIESVDSQNQTWTTSVDRTLTDGTYTLHVYGNDSVGNIAHISVTFTISTTTTTTTTSTTTTPTLTPSWNALQLLLSLFVILSWRQRKKKS